MTYAIIGIGILVIIGYALLTRKKLEDQESVKVEEDNLTGTLETVHVSKRGWITTILIPWRGKTVRYPCEERCTKHESRELACSCCGKFDIDIDGLIERG